VIRNCRVPQAVPTRAIVCAPCGIGVREGVRGDEWEREDGGDDEKGKMEREEDGSALYQDSQRRFLHDDWLSSQHGHDGMGRRAAGVGIEGIYGLLCKCFLPAGIGCTAARHLLS
jgi:hypothetical protein